MKSKLEEILVDYLKTNTSCKAFVEEEDGHECDGMPICPNASQNVSEEELEQEENMLLLEKYKDKG